MVHSVVTKLAQLEIPKNLNTGPAGQSQIDTAISIFIGIAATVAVLLIVWGGVKFITSKGDPGATAKARNTIIYAAVGLALCMLAFAIVQFVIGNV